MAEKKLNEGEIIFNEGDVADFAYIVVSGKVDLLYINNNSETTLATMEAGKVFGELALFVPQEPRPYTARAVDACVLQSTSTEEFQGMLAQCPPALQPLLSLAFEKITPVKTKAKAPVTTVSKGDIAKISIAPASEAVKSHIKPLEILVSTLPFRIGGYPEDGERNRKDQVHLAIPAQKNPLLVSRQHCEIILDENDNIIVSDLGSRFCTMVNGVYIGRGRGAYNAPLKKGANEIALGTSDKYKLAITCK